MTTGVDPRCDHLGVVATAARRLAAEGAAALPDVLQGLADGLSVGATVTIRRPEPGGLAGLAAERPPILHASTLTELTGEAAAIPRMRSADSTAVLSLPLRVRGRVAGFLTVVADARLDPTDVALVEAHADLLALTLVADQDAVDSAGRVLEEEADRAEVAADLHEGPMACLVAARYALDSAADLTAAGNALQHAWVELRRIVLGQRARGLDGDLAGALRSLATELTRTGCPVDLRLTAIEPGSVPAPAAVTAYRAVVAALRGVHGPVTITAGRSPAGDLNVAVTGAEDVVDAGAIDRWARRIRALGGTVERRPDGLTLHLPGLSPVASTSGAAR